MEDERELVIVGGGRSGLEAARYAMALGVQPVLVERDVLGGRHAIEEEVAAAYGAVGRAIASGKGALCGLDFRQPTFRFARVAEWVRGRVEGRPRAVLPPELEVVEGEARFIEPGALMVGDRTLRAKRVILATGSRVLSSELDGIEESAVPAVDDPGTEAGLTLRHLLALRSLPRAIAFVGATPDAIVAAQGFARLGSEVLLIDESLERGDLLAEAGRELIGVLEDDGVRLVTKTQLIGLRRADGGWVLTLRDLGTEEREVAVTEVVLSPPLLPDIESLALAGGEVDSTIAGIRIDEALKTSNQSVWAVGGATGEPCAANLARCQARLAVRAAVHGEKVRAHREHQVRSIGTDPPLAVVGLGEREAGERGTEARAARISLEGDERRPFLTLVADGEDRVLGAASLSSDALLYASLVAMAMGRKMTLDELADHAALGGVPDQALVKAADQLRGNRPKSTWRRLTGRFALR